MSTIHIFKRFATVCIMMGMLFSLCPTEAQGNPSDRIRPFTKVGPENAERGPRFPWSAFVRFWNTWCAKGAEIGQSQPVKDSHIVLYGYSVSLVVDMEEGVVRRVTAVYADPSVLEGGLRWKKLVDSMITVGTYRWPRNRAEEVRQRFRAITPTLATYIWQNSCFERQQDSQAGWVFQLHFLDTPVYN